MGKASVITLSPTQTFTEEMKKTEGTEIVMGGDKATTFSPGLSVFSEEVPKWRFWRTPRKLIILLDGAGKAFELKKQSIEPNYWTLTEKKKFIAKTIAKSKAEQKPMTNTQFYVLAFIGLAALGLLGFLLYKFGAFGALLGVV